MRKILSLSILILTALTSNAQYDHQNIDFLGRFDDSTVVAEHVYGIRYQACWGWVDNSDAKEYGILGSTAGTYIIEVTDPTNPVQRDYIPGRQNDCIWHEYKTYQNYLYIISDDGGNNSFQIADLSYLPDSVHVVYDSTDIFVHAHTLTIEGDLLYVASVTSVTDVSSMNVYSLADPVHPTLLRRLDQDYPSIDRVHDMFVVHDTVYASCGYDGMFIYRYDTAANQFIELGNIQNGFGNYNHSSVLSPDHNILYMCEEVPAGQPVRIIDVNDIANPSLVDTFYSNQGATPHNPTLLDNWLIVAYYQDGVLIYDISNPQAPVLSGFFDTYMANPPGTYLQPAYAGAWSAYSDLPSRTLLVGDMQQGLFCLNMSAATGIDKHSVESIRISPNPATNYLKISGTKNAQVEILDLNGRLFRKSNITSGDATIDLSDFATGVYVVRVIDKENVISRKVVITKN